MDIWIFDIASYEWTEIVPQNHDIFPKRFGHTSCLGKLSSKSYIHIDPNTNSIIIFGGMGGIEIIWDNSVCVLSFTKMEDKKEGNFLNKFFQNLLNIEEPTKLDQPSKSQTWLKEQVIEEMENKQYAENWNLLGFNDKSDILLLNDDKSIDEIATLKPDHDKSNQYMFSITPIYEKEEQNVGGIVNAVRERGESDAAVRLEVDPDRQEKGKQFSTKKHDDTFLEISI